LLGTFGAKIGISPEGDWHYDERDSV
jgi:hypothetical protein